MDSLNSTHHRLALRLFTVIVLVHFAEHLVQSIQVYLLGWPLPEARGVLGIPFPWLVKSEFMHYAYALVMLIGMWVLRHGFVGRDRRWWQIALGIQFWHHFEHLLLQGQAIAGVNFLGAPAPISVIQMVGLLEGPASTGFGGLMSGPPAHPLTALTFFVRRVEVHMIYNTLVLIPMAVAMFYHLLPDADDAAVMRCTCAHSDQTGEAPRHSAA